MAGLSAPVTRARDGLGIPTIRGGSRDDRRVPLAFCMQGASFQMDLARRRAAASCRRSLDLERWSWIVKSESSLSRRSPAGVSSLSTRDRELLARTPPRNTPASLDAAPSSISSSDRHHAMARRRRCSCLSIHHPSDYDGSYESTLGRCMTCCRRGVRLSRTDRDRVGFSDRGPAISMAPFPE